jgi:Protein kinase domain
MNRLLALKTMTTSVADNPNLLERFYREAQSAGFLQHPNIVTIYDLGDEMGTPFIAMELVDGPNLDDLITGRSELPLHLKLVYSVQACRAFDYAHKRGIIHRDIKPGNVMVNKEGRVKVVDFGIARVLEASKTQTGTLIGTFSYMAPEIFHGKHANERSDIWSFGVLLYELLTYKQAFAGESPAALMQSICLQEPVPLRQVAPECPGDLESLVHRMLQKSEAERFQTMEDLLLALEPICNRLQAEAVTEILERSGQLIEQEEFAQAHDLLHQALQVDAGNIGARALSDKVNAGLKRLSLRKGAHQHVEQGRALLQEGKPQEASAEVENALHLDSEFPPAHELQQEVQREIKRLRLIGEYLESAKQLLVEGLPDEAEELLHKAKGVDPSNQQLVSLQQQVLDEKERRQRRLQLQEGMQKARLLWIQRKYQECADVLTQLQRAFPDQDDIIRLLETAREDQAEQNKQEGLAEARHLLVAGQYEECIAGLMKLQEESAEEDEIKRLLQTARADQVEENKRKKLDGARKLLSARKYDECIALLAQLHQDLPEDDEIGRMLDTAREDQAEHDRKEKLAAARDLLAAQRFADALALLDSLLSSDPKDSAALKLRTLAQREQETQAKSETLQCEWEVLKKLVSEREYQAVVARAESLLRQFPDELDLVRLVDFARSQQVQVESDMRLRSTRDQVQELLHANRSSEAAEAALAALTSFPGNPDLSALLKQAQAHQKKEMVRQLIERRIREIRVKIRRGRLTEAKELAHETLTRLGSDVDVYQVLSYEPQEKKGSQDQTLENIRALLRSGKLEHAASTLEELIKSGDFDALDPRLYEVAEEIAAAREAAAVPTKPIVSEGPQSRARELPTVDLSAPTVDSSGAGSQPATQSVTVVPGALPVAPEAAGDSQPAVPPANAGSPAELGPAAIDHAARMLARYIGPIAGILAKRAARRADSLRAFYLLLAEELEGNAERARFLRDAGFPDS